MSKAVIVGGGIIGLFTAYYLSENGFEVTIVDKSDLSTGCSTGNAGMIVPSHIVPLASPGIVEKGLKWMLSSKSPFYIHPRFDKRLVQWCLLFYKASTQKHVNYSIPYLKNIGLLSKSLYQNLMEQYPDNDIRLTEKGLIMLYKSEKVAEEEREFAQLANQHGLKAEILTSREVQLMEPNQGLDVLGGIYFPEDSHLDPAKLYTFLVKLLEERGVKICRNEEATDFTFAGNRVKAIITDKNEYPVDFSIICAGAWSAKMARKLKINMPLLGGKGYTFVADNTPEIQHAAILTEAKVSVSPLGGKVRFGGTMEITSADGKVNMNRVKGIHEAIGRYYPGFNCPFPDESAVWSGLRPCSPDGLPYIGYTKRWQNVLFGTGHSMMGVSLAPATGKILASLMTDKKLGILIDAFSPDRYS